LIFLFETSIANHWEIAIKLAADELLAAAVLVFLTRAAGAGIVTADFFTGGNGDFLRLPLGGSFFLLDGDREYIVDDIMLYAGNETLKKGVAFFFVDHYGFDLPHSI
jgi:hypothetical protein